MSVFLKVVLVKYPWPTPEERRKCTISRISSQSLLAIKLTFYYDSVREDKLALGWKYLWSDAITVLQFFLNGDNGVGTHFSPHLNSHLVVPIQLGYGRVQTPPCLPLTNWAKSRQDFWYIWGNLTFGRGLESVWQIPGCCLALSWIENKMTVNTVLRYCDIFLPHYSLRINIRSGPEGEKISKFGSY